MIALYILGAIVALIVYLFLGKVGRILTNLICVILDISVEHDSDLYFKEKYDKNAENNDTALFRILWPLMLAVGMIVLAVIVVIRFAYSVFKLLFKLFKLAWK